jgi:ATP synthase protein I
MADPNPPPDSASGDPAALRRKAEAARAARESGSTSPASSAASLALRFGGEFGAAVLVGAGLGFGADYWLRTSPWGLVIGLSLGFAAGVVNVVRLARKSDGSAADRPEREAGAGRR